MFLIDFTNFNLINFLQGDSFLNALKSFSLALLVWIIGSMLINRVVKIISMGMEKGKMDASLRPFLVSMISVLLKVLLLLAVASTLGMDVMSFVAILSAAAFAVGMALQGGLSNFAGGVMILLFKPFKVGDLITAQGFEGTVKEIQVFNTLLITLDHQVIIIPNGALSNGAIQNHSMVELRGVNLVFGISYTADIDLAKKIIYDVAASCPQVEDPTKTTVVVSSLGDNSVNISARPWTKPEHWWAVNFYMHEQVKKEFDKANIGIPFPQMDVHLIK